MVPVSVNRESCPQEVIDKEMHIYREQIRMEGKPEDMVEKIALGNSINSSKSSLSKTRSLLRKARLTVKEYLKTVDPQVKVTGFYRLLP
jgi:elongation factor Ts